MEFDKSLKVEPDEKAASAAVRSVRRILVYCGVLLEPSVNRPAKIHLAALVLTALAAGALGGCGRAGPLEPPPDAQAVAKQASADEDNSGVPRPHPRPKAIEAPKQPFLLDPLL